VFPLVLNNVCCHGFGLQEAGEKGGERKGRKKEYFYKRKMLIILYTIIIARILCACAVLHCAVMKNCAV